MKSLKILSCSLVVLTALSCKAQMNNEKTEIVTVTGNCGMCKSTIEKAGNAKGVATVSWDKETKLATLMYDSLKTNRSAILKRIAIAGYDSEEFLAPMEAYDNLPGCCKYARTFLPNSVMTESEKEEKLPIVEEEKKVIVEGTNLQPFYLAYFQLKEALVGTNGTKAAEMAGEMQMLISSLNMNLFSEEGKAVWQKKRAEITDNVEHISGSKDVKHQRDHFVFLSQDMVLLMKAEKFDQMVYIQHCPMANNGKGADWLSLDKTIKNPYYGNQMLSCGSTTETIK
jgi:copper chaperone CopZ